MTNLTKHRIDIAAITTLISLFIVGCVYFCVTQENTAPEQERAVKAAEYAKKYKAVEQIVVIKVAK